ncbi:DUF4428 domain-containing protein [Xylocopilactobacillus apicola]|uniref:DUF4428 domain-containing protein n=1 Tax=Xylocopilactobacillus apicola TaxID=2932184 RepID=A0AAU9CUN0_9LACO|nr:DUF4428 domain-containing protein [Xylocopilactobacillus apicola]BDR57719.1 hypothetical protein XA3_01600 [Xylocopilactobacillus apicola]
MKQDCVICGQPLGFMKFKCRDGAVCKKCYRIVSQEYTQTIVDRDTSDLLAIFEKYKSQPDFDITRRINQYLLFDDPHQLICLPNNRKYSDAKLPPEFFSYRSLKSCSLVQDTIEIKGKVRKNLELKLSFDDSIERKIVLIKKPIEVNSSIYQSMNKVANQIINNLAKI